MQAAQRIRPRSVLDWIDRQPDRISLPLGFALGMVPSLGMMLVSPTAGLVTGGLTLGAAVWLGLTGEPIALPLSDSPEPIEMVELPGGEFWMGSPENEPGRHDDELRHRVQVRAFAIGKYPVTQKQYQELMGENPSHHQEIPEEGERAEDRPVENVSWFDAVRFCNRLSEKNGRKPCYRITEPEAGSDAPPQVEWDREADGYRLPTEAEWEYACRAGTETTYSFGDEEAKLGEYGWFERNSNNQTHAVGQKKPNGWDLHDLHGNVWEWCWDWYDTYKVTSDNGKIVKLVDPMGTPTGTARVLRGGCFFDGPGDLRSALRYRFVPVNRVEFVGFRCVRNSRRQS
jgi:formylglycine-generating enzyme required for sulfatase activity